MSAAPISRRAFLLGRSAATAPMRPPWSVAAFAERCTRCGDCAAACPEHVIAIDHDGLPRMDFSAAACTFCGACAERCTPHALLHDDERATPRQWRPSIGDACLARHGVYCMSCRDACADDALRFVHRGSTPLPEIDAARCSGCGACVGACPVQAVAMQDAASP